MLLLLLRLLIMVMMLFMVMRMMVVAVVVVENDGFCTCRVLRKQGIVQSQRVLPHCTNGTNPTQYRCWMGWWGYATRQDFGPAVFAKVTSCHHN